LIRHTVNRLKDLDSAKNIFIVASAPLCQKIQKEIPEIPWKNFIIEPNGKNTGPAVGLAALHIYKKDPQAVMGIYPSDHLISGKEKFKDIVRESQKVAAENSVLMTIGITPTYPATGYGYIQYDAKKNGLGKGVYRVKTFAEKPHLAAAKNFVKSGEFLWNSGIFIWKAELILLEMKTFMCELHDSLDAIYDAIDTPQYDVVLDREWELIRSESIDYGILEKAKNVHTIKADFEWNDMGNWQSLFNMHKKNENGSVHNGDVVTVGSHNNLVISPNRLTALIGVKDMTIVNLMDATLIMPHSEAEKVKNIVNMLETMNKEDYL